MMISARLMKAMSGGLVAAAALASATPAFAWQDGWSYRTRITLTPSATGANGTIGAQPVLVRLHSGNFAFKDAKPDGSDIRFFAGDDKTPLKYVVEKWDAQGEVGLVWVQVPGLSGSGATPIYVYYGNPKASPAGDAKGVFGSQALVWHFADAGAPQDSSGNGVTGSANGGRDPNGLIGQALKLDGSAGVGMPTSFQLTGASTVSMWVKPDKANSAGTLFAGGLSITLENGVPTLAVGAQKAAATAPLALDAWTHIAAVADGQKTTLYINGQAAGSVPGALPAAGGQATVGSGFAGEIDEVEVTKSALPVDAIMLAANSQGLVAKLATFDKAEQIESGGNGKFGKLFASLTFDAWLVLAVLAILFVAAIWVMISKYLLTNKMRSANDEFAAAYEKVAAGHSDHDGLVSFDPGPNAASSSLGHLYGIAQRELGKRLAEGKRGGGRYAIRAQSVASIRSAIDAGQVRIKERLDTGMVLLSLAIAGAPFIGLAGTALGVMNTFADVAAAGDVNINSIAPGMAAALLCTVAGLLVAVPALFGFNLLKGRAKRILADNQIFADELEKRIAETWQTADGPAPLAHAA
jgi:biopolymer transport protein ExbB